MTLRSIAILRGHDPRRSVELAARCWEIGMDLVEVPVQGDAGWASLEAVAASAAGRPFGAGTVLTAESATRAVELGASAIISPGVDREVVEVAQRAGAVALPGVMTPTDVGTAVRLGVEVCKLFPASVVGPVWIGAMHGPFPSMRFIAVGGVDDRNAADYLRAGASGVGLGSSIENVLRTGDPAGVIAGWHAIADGDAEVAAAGSGVRT